MKLANHLDRRPSSSSATASPTSPTASDGRFGPDPMTVYDDWDAFADFAAAVTDGDGRSTRPTLGCPCPGPGRCSPSG